jgi:hypothetical protein
MEAQRKEGRFVCNITAYRSCKISPDDDVEAINDRCIVQQSLDPNTDFSNSRPRGGPLSQFVS